MSEWWTYRPSDFLMFSARSWGRLLEGWNRDLWPLQPVLVLAGLLVLWFAARSPAASARWIPVLLAVAWAWLAAAFHWQRFAAINTGARWSALAFAAEAVLLLVLGMRGNGMVPSTASRGIGLLVAVAALIAYPLWAPLVGRGWAQSEVAGAAPDPTALLTAGLLLALPLRHRAWLLVIPVLVLVVGWTTDWLLWAT